MATSVISPPVAAPRPLDTSGTANSAASGGPFLHSLRTRPPQLSPHNSETLAAPSHAAVGGPLRSRSPATRTSSAHHSLSSRPPPITAPIPPQRSPRAAHAPAGPQQLSPHTARSSDHQPRRGSLRPLSSSTSPQNGVATVPEDYEASHAHGSGRAGGSLDIDELLAHDFSFLDSGVEVEAAARRRSLAMRNQLPLPGRHIRSTSTDVHLQRPASSIALPRRVRTSPGGILGGLQPPPISSTRLSSISSSVRSSPSHISRNSGSGSSVLSGNNSSNAALSQDMLSGSSHPAAARDRFMMHNRSGSLGHIRPPPTTSNLNMLGAAAAAAGAAVGPTAAPPRPPRSRSTPPLNPELRRLLDCLAEENNKLHLQLSIVCDIFQHGLQDSHSDEVVKMKNTVLALHGQNNAIVDKLISMLFPELSRRRASLIGSSLRERAGAFSGERRNSLTQRLSAHHPGAGPAAGVPPLPSAAAASAVHPHHRRLAHRSGSMPPMAAASAAVAAQLHATGIRRGSEILADGLQSALSRTDETRPMLHPHPDFMDDALMGAHISPPYHHTRQHAMSAALPGSAEAEAWAAAATATASGAAGDTSPYLGASGAVGLPPMVSLPPPANGVGGPPAYDSTAPYGSQVESPSMRARPYRVVQCKYEYRPGGCPRGESCTFKHTKTPYEHAANAVGGGGGASAGGATSAMAGPPAGGGGVGGEALSNGGGRHERSASASRRRRDGDDLRAPALSSSLCKHWNKLSGCQYRGGQCRFTHQCNNCDSPTHGYFQCEQKCRKYEEGSCVYGNRCFLRHGDGPTPRLYSNSAATPTATSPYPVPAGAAATVAAGTATAASAASSSASAAIAAAAAATVAATTELVAVETNSAKVLTAQEVCAASSAAAAASASVATSPSSSAVAATAPAAPVHAARAK